ncbi:uncharacterized protein BP5553_07399 [Venustampulla echinocandica]|uniref:DOC domain-containing protein n=1 Tax=Venustampulla echinocandica TaxID=2656787 RepID=A0A370TJE4_9HELO|nr:uncharacterized protein BP5553_07399 [Venustampulla echinocandica]RDL35468.1 hypothetical protein BP5553_07399 [Venustampulla echinocandica]
MAPTPPSPSFSPPSQPHPHPHLRLARLRRPRNANPYDAAHRVSQSPSASTSVTPLMDQVAEDQSEAGLGGGHSGPDGVEEDDDLDLDQQDDVDEDGHGDDEFGEDGNDGDEDVEGGIGEVPMDIDPPFDPAALGLKEIGNLASWTVSSSKPGCGVEALRDEDTNLFWQSDGPQPHHLNIHFSRLVSVRCIRVYLDFQADESYTPTRITILAGTGYHDLIPFSSLEFERPVGWTDVPLEHVGGGADGKTLRAFLVQVRVVENHQNGKDTHVRGLKVYARDERARGGLVPLADSGPPKGDLAAAIEKKGNEERTWLVEPEWMGDPELR